MLIITTFTTAIVIGLLKICDKLANPFSDDETSFPEYAYGKYIHYIHINAPWIFIFAYVQTYMYTSTYPLIVVCFLSACVYKFIVGAIIMRYTR